MEPQRPQIRTILLSDDYDWVRWDWGSKNPPLLNIIKPVSILLSIVFKCVSPLSLENLIKKQTLLCLKCREPIHRV